MEDLKTILLELSGEFDQAMDLGQEGKQVEVEPVVVIDMSQEELMGMDFGDQGVMELLVRSLPYDVFDKEVLDKVEQLRIRHIPTQRRTKLFAGHYQTQKKHLQKKQKQLQPQLSIVPQNYLGSADFKLIHNSKQQFISLRSEDLAKLNENQDLNDTIMSSYIKILKVFFLVPELAEKVFFFSTFFMSQLMSGITEKQQNSFVPYKGIKQHEQLQQKLKQKVRQNYPKVKNWTKKIDIFNMDYLLIPMNPSNHWNLLIIINPGSILTKQNKCKIIGLDSMFQIKQIFYSIVKIYLQLKAAQVIQREVSVEEVGSYQVLVPRQTNNHDCGLYLLTYIQVIFSDWGHVGKLGTDQRNFLGIFPRQLVQSMRVQLKNLLYSLMKNRQNPARILFHIEQYKKSRIACLNSSEGDYDEIDTKQLQKYCKLNPYYSEQIKDSITVKFYLDSDINFYQKTTTKP